MIFPTHVMHVLLLSKKTDKAVSGFPKRLNVQLEGADPHINLLDLEHAIFPVNPNKNHWSFLCILFCSQRLQYCNSFGLQEYNAKEIKESVNVIKQYISMEVHK